MMDTINTTFGSCIDLDVVWSGEDGAPMDLTDDVISVYERSHDAFDEVVVSVINPISGSVHIHLDEENAKRLPLGRASWFRLARTTLGECTETTPRIWVNVS